MCFPNNIRKLVAAIAMAMAPTLAQSAIIFNDVTESSLHGGMVSTESWGVSFGDYNGDYWPDIMSNGHRNRAAFYRNNGDGTLSNVILTVGQDSPDFLLNRFQDQHMFGFGDLDGDGDDDLGENRSFEFFSSQNELFTAPGQITSTENMAQIATDCPDDDFYPLGFDENQDFNLSFDCHRPATTFSSVSPSISHMLDLANADFDGDGLLDVIAVRGSYFISDAVLVAPTRVEAGFAGFNTNDHSFTFDAQPPLEVTVWSRRTAVETVTLNGSGTAGDIRFTFSGGEWTVFGQQSHIIAKAASGISNLSEVSILRNTDLPLLPKMYKATGGGSWQDVGFQNGFRQGVRCAGITAGDFDNDMDMDIYMSCRGGGVNIPNRLYENDGTGRFSLVANAGGAQGITGGTQGDRAGTSDNAIAGDYNNDGFLDLLLVNGHLDVALRSGGPHQLFRNAGNANHWVQLRLIGNSPNFDALGAKVVATAGGVNQVQLQDGGNHRSSQDLQRLHFGLAGNTSVDIEVTWPNGNVQAFTNLSADQIYEVRENQSPRAVTLQPVGEFDTPDPGDECGTPDRFAPHDYALFLYRTNCSSNVWTVRVSPGSQTDRIFTGQLLTSGGSILSVTPAALETNDSLTWDASAASFSFAATDNSEDGFSFTLSGDACLGVYTPDGVQILVGPDYKRIGLSGINPNTMQACSLDSDGDGIPNNIDPDDDNDGVPDVNDDLPNDPNESVDTDGDGIGNNADNDDDGDGVADRFDDFPLNGNETVDTDGDGIGNNADPDDDGDGTNDNTDAFPLDPNESADSDSDGVGNNADAFPNDPNETSDLDGDGVGDNGDIDSDNDGLPNSVEGATGGAAFQLRTPRVTVPGRSSSLTTDVDLSSQAVGIGQTVTVSNVIAAGDLNSDSETFTLNFNDGELVRSGLNTGIDCGNALNAVSPSVNATITVIDIGGGVPGIRITGTTTQAVGGSSCGDADYRLTITGQGASVTDSDGDGKPDYLDLDSDNDSIADVIEAGGTDANVDSFIDNAGANEGSITTPIDTDGDGVADFRDLESNNSANNGNGPFDIAGTTFAAADTNGDGTISNADVNGGNDADDDGIDNLVDNLPNQPGTGTGGSSGGGGIGGVPAISWSAADFSASESSATATLTVNISPAATGGETVRFATLSGSASPGADYFGAAPTVTFAAGDTSQTVTVELINDAAVEPDETFSVRLFSPTGGASVGSTNIANVTIVDDDNGGATPTLATQSVTINEADGTANIVVTLSPVATSTVTVRYSTVANTATGGTDYYGTSGILTFNAGETQKSWPITIVDNQISEPNESFNARLFNETGATISQALTPITIADDDGGSPLPGLSVSDITVSEGDGLATVTVDLDTAANVDVTVFTQDGTTQGGGQDFYGFTRILQFRNGETSKQVSVTLIDDNTPESDEVLKVRINNAIGADLIKPIGDVTIQDDD